MIDAIPDTQPTTDRQRREALYRAFEEHVDPKIFDGASCGRCLIGQVAHAMGGAETWHESTVEYLASRFDVDYTPLARIFSDVCEDEYRHDYAAAMRMAKERLGLA